MRVINGDGTTGKLIGDWLTVCHHKQRVIIATSAENETLIGTSCVEAR